MKSQKSKCVVRVAAVVLRYVWLGVNVGRNVVVADTRWCSMRRCCRFADGVSERDRKR